MILQSLIRRQSSTSGTGGFCIIVYRKGAANSPSKLEGVGGRVIRRNL